MASTSSQTCTPTCRPWRSGCRTPWARAPSPWSNWSAVCFFQAEDGIRDKLVTGVQTCALPISFFTLCANLGHPCATDPGEKLVERPVAAEALGAMRALLSVCPTAVLDWNSIDVHDAMVASDTLVYCPAVYCYATYAESDMGRPLGFHDLPGVAGPDPRGSTIGGTGLGISAYCREPEAALAYAGFLLDAATQKAFAAHHGQPARVEAWTDSVIDGRFGNSFSAIRRAIDSCWIRPRYPGYLAFQRRGGELVEAHLRGTISEARLIDALVDLHAVAGSESA